MCPWPSFFARSESIKHFIFIYLFTSVLDGGWVWATETANIESAAQKCGVEIAAQASMDSQNHIYCNWRHFFTLSCAKLKCIGLLFNFFYLLQYLLSYGMA